MVDLDLWSLDLRLVADFRVILRPNGSMFGTPKKLYSEEEGHEPKLFSVVER
jgi:hypothetical protein